MKPVNVNVSQNDLRQSFNHRERDKQPSTEFKELFESYLKDQEETEEFRVLIPKHGHFWDNGYEDVG